MNDEDLAPLADIEALRAGQGGAVMDEQERQRITEIVSQLRLLALLRNSGANPVMLSPHEVTGVIGSIDFLLALVRRLERERDAGNDERVDEQPALAAHADANGWAQG